VHNKAKTNHEVYDFESGKEREIDIADAVSGDSILSGHGGGDNGIIHSFYEMLCGKVNPELSNISVSVKNYMIAFAAEKSRLEGRVVDVSEMDYDKVIK
jgi:hypothetical protein